MFIISHISAHLTATFSETISAMEYMKSLPKYRNLLRQPLTLLSWRWRIVYRWHRCFSKMAIIKPYSKT